MAVLSTKQMVSKSQVAAGAEASADLSVAETKEREKVWAVRLPSAPKNGKARVAFRTPNGTEKVEVVDQYYHFKDLEERKRLLNSMMKEGFVKADYQVGEKPEPPKKPEGYRIRYAHPDNEPDNPKQGSVAVTVGRGSDRHEVTLNMDEYGTVTTEDEQLQRKLKRLGWTQIHKEPIEPEGDSQQT